MPVSMPNARQINLRAVQAHGNARKTCYMQQSRPSGNAGANDNGEF